MKNKLNAVIFTFLTLACIAFIFSNSLKNGQQSSGMSNGVCGFLVSILQKIGITVTVPDISHAVRKLAHFSEFCLLGVLGSCMFVRGYGQSGIFALPMGMLTAATDEFIQYFVPERACMFTDWCIDSTGLSVGIAFVTLILHLRCRKTRRNP